MSSPVEPGSPSAAPAAKREYEVVKMTKGGGSVVWRGGCRNCADMIRNSTKRDHPGAIVYVR